MREEHNTIAYFASLIFGWFAATFGVDWAVMLIVGLSFTLDFLTGMLKSVLFGEYKSKIGWVKTVTKILGLCIIFVFSLFVKKIGIESLYISMPALMILACHDLISATSNIYAIRTGKKLPEVDVISIVIKQINLILVKIVKGFIKDDDHKDKQI